MTPTSTRDTQTRELERLHAYVRGARWTKRAYATSTPRRRGFLQRHPRLMYVALPVLFAIGIVGLVLYVVGEMLRR